MTIPKQGASTPSRSTGLRCTTSVPSDGPPLARGHLGRCVAAGRRDRSIVRPSDRSLPLLIHPGLRWGGAVDLGSWLSIDLGDFGSPAPDGVPMPQALAELAKRTGRPVVLVIDEAQHASTTPAGENATFALRSARDTMNAGAGAAPDGDVGLELVMTGSNRDKLASLAIGGRRSSRAG